MCIWTENVHLTICFKMKTVYFSLCLRLGICIKHPSVAFFSNPSLAAAGSLMGPNLVVRADPPKSEVKVKLVCKSQRKN